MTKPVRWKGELAKPIRVTVNRPHGFAEPDRASDPDAEGKIIAENEFMDRLRDEAREAAETRKLPLLAKHYDVDENDYRALVLALAREFVPGFRFINPIAPVVNYGPQYGNQKESGRPVYWDGDRLWRLAEDVGVLKAKEGLTDREALERLSRKSQWAPPIHSRGSDEWVETLESRRHDARRLIRQVKKIEEDLAEIKRKMLDES
jgi:hypothetical protein